jgi:hypothetical protein
VLSGFCRCGAEKFFEKIGAAGEVEFFSNDAEGVFAGDEMDPVDPRVGFEGAEEFAAKDCAGGAGDGES